MRTCEQKVNKEEKLTLIDHPGMMLNFPLGALARLGLARAYAMQRDTAKARAAYQDFLTLWKHADRDLPILIAAESEYAKLKWPFEFLEKGSPLLARSRQLPAG